MQTRVRFAPSPTGYLHIGGARTALFNWLFARHTGGLFVLRIEDTDAARNTQEATEVILSGLRWLGLDWDEGPTTADPAAPSKGDFGPYYQSQRGEIHRRRIQELLDKDMAYKADGAVKFRMEREPIVIPDLIVGDVRRELTDRERLDPDFVIVRSDGQPVFHLVNVLDDLEMKITHVIRGEDHLTNTAKHIALFRAFGVEPPKYAHIPLILNPDGAKMSKRDRGASLQTYINDGYAPEAVVNYLCLLGWSPKENREKIPLAETIKLFDLPQVLRHNARFDIDKLHWLDGEYIREMSDDRFRELGIEALRRAGYPMDQFPDTYLRAALATCKGKIKRFGELDRYAGFYFRRDFDATAPVAGSFQPSVPTLETASFHPGSVAHLTPEAQEFTSEVKVRLVKFRDALAALPEFHAPQIEAALKALAAELKIKPGLLVHPIRLALTGSIAGPSLYHLMEVLDREIVLERLKAIVDP